MKIFKNILSWGLVICLSACFFSCGKSFLSPLPGDRIIQDQFWKNSSEAELALNGIYSNLRSTDIYGYGPGLDACTPNGYQWTPWEGNEQEIGNGSLTSSTGGLVSGRWTTCYKMIYDVNNFLENLDKVDMDEDTKNEFIGEAHFLRGVAYSLLAETYGGVPIIDSTISVDQAEDVKRSSLEETWNKVIDDYDISIKNLDVQGRKLGSATLGAALGMKMRAYLYQNNYPKVLELTDKIDSLNMYSLFPSYYGLFQLENEHNSEVVFDVEYIDGENSQGSIFDQRFQPQNLKFGISGSNSVAPIQDLVDDYEMISGLSISDPSSGYDPANPYKDRDPRLDFTILRPGAFFQDQLYPEEIKNHTGQRVGFGIRKYTIETQTVIGLQSPLNFIVLRYGNVLMAKAEALIETGGDIDEAIDIINRFRTERNDVKIAPLPHGLSQTEARAELRHERRIEFAFEGQYWADIKRWDIGKDIYPVEVRGGDGGLIERKFPNGYLERYNLLPIPDDEISMNKNLEQNPDW